MRIHIYTAHAWRSGKRIRDVNSHSVVITGYRFEEGKNCPTENMRVYYYDSLLPKEKNPAYISYRALVQNGSKEARPDGPWNTSLVLEKGPYWYSKE